MHSEETKRKMSDATKGKPKSEAHRTAISRSKVGKNHPNWGKNLDENVKAKIRASNVNAPSPNKKVNWEMVDEIRMLFRLGKTITEIVRDHYPTLSRSIIYDIVRQRTWKEEFRIRD